MARLTKEEHDEILKRFMGDEQNDEVEDFIDKLRKDFDESLEVDSKEAKEDIKDEGEKEVDWKERYDDLYKKYRERFFTTKEEIKEDQEKDVKKDGETEKKTYKKIFKEREG